MKSITTYLFYFYYFSYLKNSTFFSLYHFSSCCAPVFLLINFLPWVFYCFLAKQWQLLQLRFYPLFSPFWCVWVDVFFSSPFFVQFSLLFCFLRTCPAFEMIFKLSLFRMLFLKNLIFIKIHRRLSLSRKLFANFVLGLDILPTSFCSIIVVYIFTPQLCSAF